ncbi:hypothetical protein A3A21_01545 [Candidatus Jorgensenbacteria bacterium RIFCSPLOWO2_01_FULL_45_25b]|uniref:tRNA-guanine(15) transglycosylase-like domain-containing protein n=1 Tax=Candidatus Jorgensenbacteria bacterium RIFCSPLOWO2_01_FULL_45_25b TaxID=1798471 RepID=A0A1F6BTB9_9BACT|nr:MAG: hypothetical protein A3A21_01545 [Candidatus Jorgensenbacteria bacterium RIFCSPLOWO2_01_FULL_45_25b]
MLEIQKKDKTSRARAGAIHTSHGIIETPAYVIVGTHAKVRTLTPEDLIKTKTQVVIANTYHLWQRLGNEGLKTYQGVHNELGFQGPIMTDSGGFQVFSLGSSREHGVGKIEKSYEIVTRKSYELRSRVRITDEGAYFLVPSDVGGTTEKEEQFLGPKESIQIQHKLGADIIIAFDECTSPLHDYEYTKKSLARTHAWEKICLEEHESKANLQLSTYNSIEQQQLLYGVVQGGEFRDLREESAKYIGSLPFDGFAIGGSLGRSRNNMFEILDWTLPLLPEEKPRHFLGIGKIEDLFDGVEAGIDTFDCVIPTREARHGRLWTKNGAIDMMKGGQKTNSEPIEKNCACETCGEKNIRRKDLHELFKLKEPSAARLATIHNVFFFNNLMEQIRTAIKENKLDLLRKDFRHEISKS